MRRPSTLKRLWCEASGTNDGSILIALALANGQLAAASGTILGVGSVERTVSVTLYNTSRSTEQEVSLTVSRSGGAARGIFRAKMKGRETCYMSGILLDPSDVLAGSAGSAATVDYDITLGQAFSIWSRDENGAPKQSAAIELAVTEKFGLTRDGVVISGLLEEVRDLLAKIA